MEDGLAVTGIPKVKAMGDVIETYNLQVYLHGIYNVDSSALLPLADESERVTTRGHSLELLKRDYKKSIRANVLGFRMVNVWKYWNSLPEDVVNGIPAQ